MFKETMIDLNICGALRQSGFQFDGSLESCRLRLNEEKLRKTPGFREIRSMDLSPEKLSAKCRNAMFGWIHKPD
jgi:hypothetical protein